MFEPASRYYSIGNSVWTDEQGRKVVYKRRRFLPQSGSARSLAHVTIKPKDRLDLIAAQALGDPLLFWRLCDANDAMNPFDLLENGTIVRVPAPGV